MTARRRGRWSRARFRAAIRENRASGPRSYFTTGKTAGKLSETLPFPVDRAVLERGQDRFRIFCTPCHGELGDGRGMIVQRGFNPPPSFHSEEVRKKPVGHYFDVMTRGFGTMYSYASRIPARDRWAIAAYIRALQVSQHAHADRAVARRPWPATGGAAMSTNMTADPELQERLERIQFASLVVGGLDSPAARRHGPIWPVHFFPAYLVGFLYWLGISLGCMGLIMLHHLVGGSWGLVIRRPLESGAMTVLPLALLFVPIAFGVQSLYPWARAGSAGHEAVIEHSPYLTESFFLVSRRHSIC